MVKRSSYKSNSSDNPDRVRKNSNMRDRSTINRMHMYREGKAKYDRDGKVIGGYLRSTTKTANKEIEGPARIAPNRKWFGNTRTITPEKLDTFREEMAKTVNDPYSVVLKTKVLPMSLITDSSKVERMNLLTTESFQSTFGPDKRRKRVKLAATDLANLVSDVSKKQKLHEEKQEEKPRLNDEISQAAAKDIFLTAGQSKRIHSELYKVLDSSDVVIEVLDARDPLGTRSKQIEEYLKKNMRHKHLVFILNKCDLVPTWCTKKWVAILSAEYPTLAYHASFQHCFGKAALFDLLRQLALLHKDKKQISVGFIGYPNVGKSSIINTLKKKQVCKVAPIPGETKVWQYITLLRNIYLIDCPGIVPPTNDSDAEIVIKGVVRAERLADPEMVIPEVLSRVKKEYLQKTYNIEDWEDWEDFLEKIAQKFGKLLKGGDGDTKQAAVMLINDLQRGKIPYFVPPEEPEKEGKPGKPEEEEENGTITEAFVDELNKEGTKLLAKEESNEKEKDTKSNAKSKAKGAEKGKRKESEAANDSTNESSRNDREDAILLTL
ncbi:uncharacterized protein [Blastocystis hominis]|uniref:Nucleolar GTP-binding protein 2 n=1 Tax=Blastocystis hominis TaxID=12968 RepID=D8LVW3_BLAHO|nr:uncharacterized protein [Blastocystis hominis]CBK19952.2 unnamed protein product [Blastocystis hominis]|eukprot:XP_012894000.1 uncharacterized protein [Blastocystis hominis]